MNVRGTLNILEALREMKQNRVFTPNFGRASGCAEITPSIFAPSSIAVFGPSTFPDQTPDDVVCSPSTMYGISKVSPIPPGG